MIRGILSSIDVESMVLGILFFVIFAGLMFALRKTKFGRNNAMKTVISFCISLLAVFGLSKTTWDFTGIFYRIGFNEQLLYNVALVILISFFVLSGIVKKSYGRRWRLYRPLNIIGGLFTALALFTDVIYEKTTTLTISIPMLVIGLLLWYRRKYSSDKNEAEKNFSGLKESKREENYKISQAKKEIRRKKWKKRFMGR